MQLSTGCFECDISSNITLNVESPVSDQTSNWSSTCTTTDVWIDRDMRIWSTIPKWASTWTWIHQAPRRHRLVSGMTSLARDITFRSTWNNKTERRKRRELRKKRGKESNEWSEIWSEIKIQVENDNIERHTYVSRERSDRFWRILFTLIILNMHTLGGSVAIYIHNILQGRVNSFCHHAEVANFCRRQSQLTLQLVTCASSHALQTTNSSLVFWGGFFFGGEVREQERNIYVSTLCWC